VYDRTLHNNKLAEHKNESDNKVTTLNSIDPESITNELAVKLSARTRHVCALIGGGAPHAAGLPDLKGLQAAVLESLDKGNGNLAKGLLKKRNLEETLSYLRRLSTILEEGQELGGFSSRSAADLNKAITQAIIPALNQESANREPFDFFAAWASGGYYRLPIELFTINYDLLIEAGLEATAVPYFDGFVGHLRARFRPELVDAVDPEIPGALPASFVRLWKLHGSVNWEEEIQGDSHQIVRLGTPARKGAVAAIYPSDEKYDQSRRVPFVVLMDRLRRALEIPETLTLVSGYSFGDQHLNEMLFDAARSYPRSETTVLCHANIPDELANVATTARNILVLGATEAIIGGRRVPWGREDDLPGVWKDDKFLLGDFNHFAQFLATKARVSNVED